MGASAEPRSESSEIADRLDRIEIAIRDLNRVSETCSGKDTWDKADVIGKFVSGVVLGLLGLYITLTIAHGQKETQIRITHDQQHFSTDQQELQQQFAKGQQSLQEAFVNQQASSQLAWSREQATIQQRFERQRQASEYLSKLLIADPAGRATLLDEIDLAMPPDDVIRTAIKFAYPNTLAPLDPVAEAALRAIARARKRSETQLRAIADSGFLPESEMAAGLLHRPAQLLFRVTRLQGEVTVRLNENESEYITPRDIAFDWTWSGRLNEHLHRGMSNKIEFIFEKGDGPRCGGLVELSAGLWQHRELVEGQLTKSSGDEGQRHRNCAFSLRVVLDVNAKGQFTRFTRDFITFRDTEMCTRSNPTDALEYKPGAPGSRPSFGR